MRAATSAALQLAARSSIVATTALGKSPTGFRFRRQICPLSRWVCTSTKSGSTIRIDRVKSATDRYAVFFHCQTDLVETFRELYPKEFSYGCNRSILLNAKGEVPEAALRHCVALALTYHLNKRKAAR